MPDMLTKLSGQSYLALTIYPYKASTTILLYKKTAFKRLFHLTDSEANIILHFIFSDIMLHLQTDGVLQLL